jgi:hypothetical protein
MPPRGQHCKWSPDYELFPSLLWDIFQWLLALFGHMNVCTLHPDAWSCPWRFCCSYCMFVRQSCPVIHKTNSSYCYLQIKSAEQNRFWCLPQTLYKEWIYWYTYVTINLCSWCVSVCSYFKITFFLTVPCSDLTLGWCFCFNIAEEYFVRRKFHEEM